MASEHQFWLNRAIKLAKKGQYTTKPNPQVGCVIVRNNHVLGEGWHAIAGQAHAEINALNQVKTNQFDAKGATVYVSLEPCTHHGKTPPCVQALIEARISRVVIASVDPNPLVKGKGIQQLRQAGIEVVCEEQTTAYELNRSYFKFHQQGKPWVILKQAATLDGRTACANGESQWITGSQARADVHKLRLKSDAVITGINTILTDDPLLTARPRLNHAYGLTDETRKRLQPLRVVLDRALRIPVNAKLFEASSAIAIATENDKVQKQQAYEHEQTIFFNPFSLHSNLSGVIHYLAEQQCHQVMIEAGAKLSGAFIKQGLVDEIILYLAPSFLGHQGKPLLRLPNIEQLSERYDFNIHATERIGKDLKLTLRRL